MPRLPLSENIPWDNDSITFTSFQKKLLLGGLMLGLIAAWFTEGSDHADEHWQVLEFANYKLGLSSGKSLPWEFYSQIRCAFIPAIVFVLRKFFFLLHFTDPFLTTFILRVLAAVASFAVCVLLLRYSFHYIRHEAMRNVAAALTFFLWCMPYLHCRFSSENIGGILFFLGFIVTDSINRERINKKYFLLAGFLFGLSFLGRFQMAFAVAGLILWMLFIQKIRWKNLFILTCGGLIALAVGFLVDYWYYGNFVFTAYNYFDANIIKGKAAEFGVMPVWFYFSSFITDTAPPIGLLLLAGIFLSAYYFPKHPLTWVVGAFVLAHSITPHKEMRFMFPMIYALPLMTLLWTEKVNPEKFFIRRTVLKVLYYIIISINVILLLVASFKPADESVPLFRYIYRLPEKSELVIYTTCNPYISDTIENRYYSRPHTKIVTVKNSNQITADSLRNDSIDYYFVDNHNSLAGINSPSVSFECIKRTVPEWITRFNFNNWTSRAKMWCVYRIKKTGQR